MNLLKGDNDWEIILRELPSISGALMGYCGIHWRNKAKRLADASRPLLAAKWRGFWPRIFSDSASMWDWVSKTSDTATWQRRAAVWSAEFPLSSKSDQSAPASSRMLVRMAPSSRSAAMCKAVCCRGPRSFRLAPATIRLRKIISAFPSNSNITSIYHETGNFKFKKPLIVKISLSLKCAKTLDIVWIHWYLPVWTAKCSGVSFAVSDVRLLTLTLTDNRKSSPSKSPRMMMSCKRVLPLLSYCDKNNNVLNI